MDELSEQDKLVVGRARIKGQFVKIEDTIKSFKAILNGECDDLPEQAFYLVGGLDMVHEKSKQIREGK